MVAELGDSAHELEEIVNGCAVIAIRLWSSLVKSWFKLSETLSVAARQIADDAGRTEIAAIKHDG